VCGSKNEQHKDQKMKLKDFIAQLQKLEAQGHGELDVFYRHGASGDCGQLSSAHVTDEVEDTGPFDLDHGQMYISIYAGN
jgi:hypothetical protein